VSRLPFAVTVPVLFIAGLFLHLQASPLVFPNDGQFYQSWGYSISGSWAGEGPSFDRELWPGKGFWPLIIAVFHAVIGPVTISLIAFNTLVFGAAVVAMQKSVLLLTGKNARYTMVTVVLTSTPFILFGPSLLRESLFWLGTSGGVLAISYLRRRHVGLALVSAGWGALLMLAARPDAGAVFAYAVIGVLVVLIGFDGPRRSATTRLVAVAILGGLAISAPQAFELIREGAGVSDIDTAADALSDSSVGTAFSNPPETSDRDSGTPVVEADTRLEDFCSNTVVVRVACGAWENLPYALLGPFYWEYGPELIWIVSGLSTLHFLVLVVLSLAYFASQGGRHWVTVGTLVVAVVTFTMFAAILTNYGILIRFRAATEIVLIPLAIAGYFAVFTRLTAVKAGDSEPPNNKCP